MSLRSGSFPPRGRADGARRRGAARRAAALAVTLSLLFRPGAAKADDPPEGPAREARFEWDFEQKKLYVSVSFRDVVDRTIRRKLTRGLPTTIVLTAAVYRAGSTEPLSTTAHTCKITWHVWDEVYLIEVVRPGHHSNAPKPTTTIEGVLRRCAEVRDLLAGDQTQIPPGTALYLKGQVQVNPVSPQVLQKIRRWLSRPSSTSTAAPGDALFSTFTGLFLRRIGEAERELQVTTLPVVPGVKPPPEKRKR